MSCNHRSIICRLVSRFAIAWAVASFLCLLDPAPRARHSPVVAQPDSLLGPALSSDLAAWSDTGAGLEAVAQIGGTARALATESRRPIAWLAIGPRVVALSLGDPSAWLDAEDAPSGDTTPQSVAEYALRPLTHSPVFPGVVDELAVGDGFVLVREESERRTIWLVDTRDPAWPRSVRPLQLGGPVGAMAADGSRALVAVGDSLLWLELRDPTRPEILARLPVADLAGGRGVRQVALAGSHAVALDRASGFHLLSLSPDRESIDSAFVDQAAEQVVMDGDRVATFDSDSGSLQLYRLSSPLDLLPTSSITLEDTLRTHLALRGQRLSMLLQKRYDSWAEVHAFEIDARDRLRALGPERHIHMPTESGTPGFMQPLAVALGEQEQLVLLDGQRVYALAVDMSWAISGRALARWRGIGGAIAAMDHEGSALAVATEYGDAIELLTRWPDAPTPIARTGLHPFDRVYRRMVNALAMLGDKMWLAEWRGFSAVDRDSPTPLRHSQVTLRWGSPALEADDHFVYAHPARGSQLMIFARDADPAEAPTFTVETPPLIVLDMVRHGTLLWLAGQTPPPGPATGKLLAVDVSNPAGATVVAQLDLPGPATAISASGRHLALLYQNGTLAIGDTLAVIDVSNPSNPMVSGSLDVAPTQSHPRLDSVPLGDLVTVGHEVFVAHPERGLLVVDISVPEFPDEVGQFDPPSPATRLATDGRTVWVGTLDSGIVALRRAGSAPARPTRVWLPAVFGAVGPAD